MGTQMKQEDKLGVLKSFFKEGKRRTEVLVLGEPQPIVALSFNQQRYQQSRGAPRVAMETRAGSVGSWLLWCVCVALFSAKR